MQSPAALPESTNFMQQLNISFARLLSFHMGQKQATWLIYTIIVGLIPTICRILISIMTKDNIVEILSASDFVTFGLVLHISNINEIENTPQVQSEWKIRQNSMSILFICGYSVLYALSLLSENTQIVKSSLLIVSTSALAFVSSMLSYSVCQTLSKVSRTGTKG